MLVPSGVYEHRPKYDETGKRYGRLLVVARAANLRAYAAWDCVCDCGNKIVVRGACLRAGNSRSCGCARREALRAANSLPRGEAAFRCRRNRRSRPKRRSMAVRRNSHIRDHTETELHRRSTAMRCRESRPAFACCRAPCGLDRLDSDGGYEMANVRPCCFDCNNAKRTMGICQFTEWVSRLSERMLGKAN